jgi:type III secretion system FlhB-like substrate exporter
VVVRGERLVAARLGEQALALGLPIFADASLAEALARVPAGAEIPSGTHDAVARIVKVILERRTHIA